ncbi:MAG: PHP domain-containing protein [Burkholderiaceae bacterium]|nr:MAG: PHP domain-containing protein [Burkholderiaceae bacterium]
MNIDLHCHSTISDGLLKPDEVARLARNKGVDVWALTDHDEVSGLALARATAQEIGLTFVDGVEISITWANKTIHILGLHLDPTNAELCAGLAHTRSGRDRRAQQIADQLAAVGIPGAYDGALKYVANKSLIGRAHFARYIVELGVCPDVKTVFGKYLVEGKPGYVPHAWATLEDAVRWIRGAGGVAVIAHPGRYHFDLVQETAFIEQFIEAGGAGVEVITSAHSPAEWKYYEALAKKYQLKGSRGSDYHGPGESEAELGALPPLPAPLTPVWQDWF